MTIIETINQGIKEAMQKREQLRLDTLRMLKSKILTADPRCNLPDAEVVKLFKAYNNNLLEALEHAKAADRPDLIEKLKEELIIVHEFLPAALTADETKKIVAQAIAESGAKTKKDLGLVMKAVLKLNNSVDGKMAKDIAFEQLTD